MFAGKLDFSQGINELIQKLWQDESFRVPKVLKEMKKWFSILCKTMTVVCDYFIFKLKALNIGEKYFTQIQTD